MAMIRDQALGLLFQLNKDAWRMISADGSISQPVKTSIYFHILYPWLPNFLSIAISPLRKGLDEFLLRPAFEWQGVTWYFPSTHWWLTHADVSHEGGVGCNVEAHAEILTRQGGQSEFAYAVVTKDGNVRVLERPDFEEECSFFASGRAE